MSIKLIPLSRLEADPQGTLSECLDSGQALVVELPDHRLVSIQGLEPGEVTTSSIGSWSRIRHSGRWSRNRKPALGGLSRPHPTPGPELQRTRLRRAAELCRWVAEMVVHD